LLSQFLRLGNFRSGSITAIHGRCGKPYCHCHQPNQPGHSPNCRLTRKVKGKTVSESFSSAAEPRNAQSEVEAFHRFRQLSQELLEVNEKICRARPVADYSLGRGKRTAAAIHQEITRAVDQLLRMLCNGRHQAGHLDLEATEMLVRSAMH